MWELDKKLWDATLFHSIRIELHDCWFGDTHQYHFDITVLHPWPLAMFGFIIGFYH